MRPDARTYGCDRCRRQESAVLEQVGKPEFSTYAGGKAHQKDTHFRCRERGAAGVDIVESGFSGHGNFWHPEETERLEPR